MPTQLVPVLETEIKNAVFALGALKTPGPDGLNEDFYPKYSETIKQDAIVAVSKFFITGNMGGCTSDTLVALTPKIPHPEAISQLRPISCCNFIYKTISKAVVGRLKPLLSSLISPQQSSFVGGRLIQDNLLLLKKIFTSSKRKILLLDRVMP